MNTMSLFESGDSSGDISIMDMFNGKNIVKNVKKTSLEELANLIVRGGWPANINIASDNNFFIFYSLSKIKAFDLLHEIIAQVCCICNML